MTSKDISIYLSPIHVDKSKYRNYQLGNSIKSFNSESDFLNAKIALIGIKEERGTSIHNGCGDSADVIRKQLYKLTNHFEGTSIIDMGNINAGNTIKDTYFAISEVVTELIKNELVVVILGGSQDLTYANYQAYENLEQVLNLVTIDPAIDIDVEGDAIRDNNYINHIINHQPNYLFNYTNIGFQSYFVPKEVWDLMDQMYFDAYRLGMVRGNLEGMEPIVRNADLVSLDVSSIRSSDLKGCKTPSPNGFYGEEICQISKYAGASDKLSSFGIYNYNPAFDHNNIGAMLSAQIIWYFIEGVNSRENDYPIASKSNYLKYLVETKESSETLVFYKNEKNNRWWMDVPYPGKTNQKYNRHQMVPCSYEDYLKASNGEIPEKWWQTFRKLS